MRALLALLVVGCASAPVGSADPSIASGCGGEGQACCVPAIGGSSYCVGAGVQCDGSAYASASTVTAAGICGSYAGLLQPCGAGGYCFEPHVCMSAGSGPTCIDPIGGGLPGVCGNAGERCCSMPDYSPRDLDPPPPGPAVWCHLGLSCSAGGACR